MLQVSLPANANPCLIMANAEGSPVAEQYRKLKSVIVKLEKAGKLRQDADGHQRRARRGKDLHVP